MEEGPPPFRNHVLQPHHIDLLAVFTSTLKDRDPKRIPPAFLLHLYRILLNEIAEVVEPKSHHQLIQDIASGPKADSEESRFIVTSLRDAHNDLRTPDQIANLFHSVPALFLEKGDDDEPPILTRRSIFGYFCRRCFNDYQVWCNGGGTTCNDNMGTNQLNNDLLLFKTHADKRSWAQSDSYAAWEKGQTTGDENMAVENLRRFFEQHFHEHNDSGFRQHALLNLVRMHYVRGEHAAARKLLQEAINVARTSGDKLTLQHCISLLHRLPPTEPGQKPILNEIQPFLHPLEVLFDVAKLIHPQNQQPLSASFEKLTQAVGLYDHWIDNQRGVTAEGEQWAQHAVQSVIWSEAGCTQLAAVEENIVTAFTEMGGSDNNRLTVTGNRAYRLARQGRYEEGLAVLLEPQVWSGITVNDYVVWTSQIWHILVLRASRRGQDRQFREFLKPRRPAHVFNHNDYFFNATPNGARVIRDELHQVMEMRQCHQAASCIEQLLTALWNSEFQGRLNLYRTGIILLADVSMEFGMTKRCRRIIDEIMPQVMNGDDLEQRALGCFVLARCILASAENDPTQALEDAIPYLSKAEGDYKKLQCLRSLKDVQYLLSVVLHNLGRERERDEAAKRHLETIEEQTKAEGTVFEEQIYSVWKLVNEVGAFLTSR